MESIDAPRKTNSRKKNRAISNERRIEIIMRAHEVGMPRAAEEFGVSKETIRSWRRTLEKNGVQLPEFKRGRRVPHVVEGNSETQTRTKVQNKAAAPTKTKVPSSLSQTQSMNETAKENFKLRLENELLKEKIEAASQKLTRLQNALAKLIE